MKPKLKLKKEVIMSLNAMQRNRGGITVTCIYGDDDTIKTKCDPTSLTFQTNCVCYTLAGCEPVYTNQCTTVEPATGNCGATDHCSYACATEGYTNCDQCGPEIGPPVGPPIDATV